MSKKINRATHGPSWTEVILGALLSAVLGVLIGAALLVLRPVVAVKEAPKDADRVKGAVYYIEGSRDGGKARQAPQKRAAFVGGQSVSLTEDELNALAAPAPAAAPGKAPEKGKAAPKAKEPEPAGGLYAVGGANFRVREGAMQIAVPVTVTAMDLGIKLVVQARGGIAKSGSGLVFDPSEIYVGSCPVQRLPVVGGLVRAQFLSGNSIPDDIKGAWGKLASATIEGSVLKLTMP